MMMFGDPPRSNLTIQIPPSWPDSHFADDPTTTIHSPINTFAALNGYSQSNRDGVVGAEDGFEEFDFPVDAFSSNEFRMFEFKVKKCVRSRSHDWTDCPFAHPGEKARRRDPMKYKYSGAGCPEFRKGGCRKGDACEYAHGVFESWLHPSRYRTRPCKDGTHCLRRVCFFAHTPEQLRVTSPNSSPGRQGEELLSRNVYGHSPTTSSPATGSPPVSPSGLDGLTESMWNLRINNKVKLGLSISPPTWGVQMGSNFRSPRSPLSVRPGFSPVWTRCGSGFSALETKEEEEEKMVCLESGRELREKIYAKLGRENSLNRITPNTTDLEWVSELVK